MKILRISVDLSFSNTPRVEVHGLIGEKRVTLQACDEDARGLCEMVPNPARGGSGLVATGRVDHDALVGFVEKRLAEAADPKALADLVAEQERIRLEVREARAELEAAGA